MKSLFLAALVALMSSEGLALSSSNQAKFSSSQRIVAPIPTAKTQTTQVKILAPAALAAPKSLITKQQPKLTVQTPRVQVGQPQQLIVADQNYESPFAINPDRPLQNAFMSSLKISKLGLKV